MDLELNPENCWIVTKIINELCPDLNSFGNGVTYDSISFPDSYQNRPIKEEFDAKLQDYFNQLPWNKLRKERNKRIAETDYLALPDYPHATPEIKQLWMDYRQALRDLPANTTDPENPTWPVL